MLKFLPVSKSDQIQAVASLAAEIWRQHYETIIGSAQVEYMIASFQSREAIADQISHKGYEYYLIQRDGMFVGYLALVAEAKDLFLSKLYVRSSEQGKGTGSAAIAFTADRAREKGLEAVRLTVNRGNTSSIEFYRRRGFTCTGTAVADIGNGFVMDDYLFRLDVKAMPC